MSFWAELRRRNVFKVAAAYAVVAWLVVQIAAAVLPNVDAPRWIIQTIFVLLLLGFPVALLLAWAYEITAEGIKRTEEVPVEASVTRATGQRLNYAVIGLLLIAVIFLGFRNYLLESADERPVGESATAAMPESTTTQASTEQSVLPNSVAVLPLENLSPDPDQAYIAAGLHEEILNQLAKLRNLNVIARTSVLPFATNRPPIAEIAATLNVETVMEGSIRYAGDRIRVTTQLIDSRTGTHLWSETYDRAFDDVFAIESDIAMNVANAVGAQFSAEEQASIERPPTASAAAYALFLRARRGVRDDEAHMLLDQALKLDPEFAMALGLKAALYSGRLANTAISTARDQTALEPLIREYARRAIALDPDNPAAHAALAGLASNTWHWTEARESSLRALQSPQGVAQGGIYVAARYWFLAWSGDHEEAIRLARDAVTLNPLDPLAPWTLGVVLIYAGRYDEAMAPLQRAIEIAPSLSPIASFLAVTEVARGNHDAALAYVQTAEELLPGRFPVALLDIAYSYGRLGNRSNAQRLYDEITTLAADQEIGAGGWAMVNMAIGNYDEALRWLNVGAEKAARHELDAGMFSLMNIKRNFTADPMLERPEFVAVRNRLTGD